AVADLEVLQRRGVVGPDVLDEVGRPGAGEGEPAHVRDVEQPAAGPDGGVFLDHGGVLHRHVPAGDLAHPGPVGAVPVVQGGPQGHDATGEEGRRMLTWYGRPRAAAKSDGGCRDRTAVVENYSPSRPAGWYDAARPLPRTAACPSPSRCCSRSLSSR